MNDSRSPLVDTHCHLTWESFDGDLDEVVARMRAADVAQAVVVATDAATARRAREIAGAHDGLHAAAGIHPNDVPEDWAAAVDEIGALLDEGGFVAVGETGLDDYRDWIPPERQRESFAAHARLARERDLPLIVHIRDQDGRQVAYDDVATILEAHPGVRGVIHCYTGDAAHAERYRAAGFFISFSGILTFPNGGNVREVAAVTPLDRRLVETDAPFLAPKPWRGKRNEPSYVTETARALAELLGRPEDEVRRATTENARRLFRLPAEAGA